MTPADLMWGYGVLLLLASAFIVAIASGRPLRTSRYLALLTLAALANTAFVLPLTDLERLVLFDDFPKFHSTAIEHKEALLNHGSPFGVNHGFQGGIPALYLKSSFLCFTPFALVFGDDVGHRLMLVVFVALLPVALYLLLRSLVGNELVAQVAAFAAAFQLRAIEFVSWGMVPAIISLALAPLALLALHRVAFSGRRRLWVPAALWLLAALLYTHLLYFAIVVLGFGAMSIAAWRAGQRPRARADLVALGVLLAVAGAPLLVSIVDHLPMFHREPEVGLPRGIAARLRFAAGAALEFACRPGGGGLGLLLSVGCLAVLRSRVADDRVRGLSTRLLIVSAVVLALPLLRSTSLLSMLAERAKVLAYFVASLNLAVCATTPLAPRARAGLAAALLVLVQLQCPIGPRVPRTIATRSDIDRALTGVVAPGEHVLLENAAHSPPTAAERRKAVAPIRRAHWLTYLQRSLGIRCFSNIGEDPNTYNVHRDLYVTNGTYRGRPLRGANARQLLQQLEQWGVGKVCVWSDAAIEFFESCDRFAFVADTEEYRCYRAVDDVLPEVRLSGGGSGRLTAVTPFSMTVELTGVREPQTVTVARLALPYWSARDAAGRAVALAEGTRMIRFDVDRDGPVHLEYRGNRALFAAAGLALLLGVAYGLGRFATSAAPCDSPGGGPHDDSNHLPGL